MRRKFLKLTFLGLLWLGTWAIDVFHRGVFPPPPKESLTTSSHPISQWIDKSKFGMHQLVLSGTPYERGLAAGRLAKPLLDAQEKILNDQLREIVKYPFLLGILELAAIRWFWGIHTYFEPWTIQEMYGISRSTSPLYDSIVEPLTRQVAYHGLHEVGQMMVDQGGEGMGCTVVATPYGQSWILGRNFDFEGGRIFDSEKILKWVFPDEGHSFVSVIWAGMVGVVTGVNEHGIYASLNAAGSTDFRRHGTPSTLVLLKVLQFSKSAEEAIEILKNEKMFITDIFVLLDSRAGKLFRIEKSPLKTVVIPLQGPTVVTNHLIGQEWANDRINLFRKSELTSQARASRGEFLLNQPAIKLHSSNPRNLEADILRILRDKGESDGTQLPLGNRMAIDAQIATHSVIYNAPDQILYVSQGPGISGGFTGFDLSASFQSRKPIQVRSLPVDPEVTAWKFDSIQNSRKYLSQAERHIVQGHCEEAQVWIEKASQTVYEPGLYSRVLGDQFECKGNRDAAKQEWKKALQLHPAYSAQIRYLEEKLKK
jgi:hypothetical protein